MDPLLIDETLHTIVTLVVYFSGTRFRKSDPVPTTGTRFQSQIRVHSRNRVQQWPPRRLQSLFAPPLDSRLCRHRGSRCRARHHSTSRRRRRIVAFIGLWLILPLQSAVLPWTPLLSYLPPVDFPPLPFPRQPLPRSPSPSLLLHHCRCRSHRRIHRSVANTVSAVCCPTVDAAAVLPAVVLTAVSLLPRPTTSGVPHPLSLPQSPQFRELADVTGKFA
jgi:hypothetical protein